MQKDELVILAAQSKQLQGFCSKICNGNDVWNDVFQEFLIHLLKEDEKKLNDKYDNIQFIGYCCFVIRRINEYRLRAMVKVNSKNDLSKIGRDVPMSGSTDNEIEDDCYDIEIDNKFNKTMDYMAKDKSIKKYHAALLFASVNKPTREISEQIGTKQRVVIYQINKVKEKIKANLR
jgi:hypothetical protein